MKPFNRSSSCKHLLAQCSSDSEQTRFSAAASFVGGRAGLGMRFPARREMPFPLRRLLALQVLICTRGSHAVPKGTRGPANVLAAPTLQSPPAHGSPRPQAHTTLPGPRGSTHTIRGPTRPLLLGAHLVLTPRPVLTMTNTWPSSSALALHLH